MEVDKEWMDLACENGLSGHNVSCLEELRAALCVTGVMPAGSGLGSIGTDTPGNDSPAINSNSGRVKRCC